MLVEHLKDAKERIVQLDVVAAGKGVVGTGIDAIGTRFTWLRGSLFDDDAGGEPLPESDSDPVDTISLLPESLGLVLASLCGAPSDVSEGALGMLRLGSRMMLETYGLVRESDGSLIITPHGEAVMRILSDKYGLQWEASRFDRPSLLQQ